MPRFRILPEEALVHGGAGQKAEAALTAAAYRLLTYRDSISAKRRATRLARRRLLTSTFHASLAARPLRVVVVAAATAATTAVTATNSVARSLMSARHN